MTYIDRFFEEKIFLKIENTTELNIVNHHAEQRGVKPLNFLDFDELCYNVQIKQDDLLELLGG